MGEGKFRRFLAHSRKVYRLDELLDRVRDSRRDPRVAMSLIARIVLVVGVLRIRSFNAVECFAVTAPGRSVA